MSSLALMRLLESAPDRYDAGMRWLTLGRVSRLQEEAAAAATPTPGARVLEIGCGTGTVTALLVGRGARVTALDHDPEMLARARARLAGARGAQVGWNERTASEIDDLPEQGFDAVVASLCLSEMAQSERRFVLAAALRRLRPGGLLVVADEVVPRSRGRRALHAVLRAPQALLGWLLAGSLSRPIPDLAGEIRSAGFALLRERRTLLESLAVSIAERPERPKAAEATT